MAGVWSFASRCVKSRIFNSLVTEASELKCFGFRNFKNVAFYSAQSYQAPLKKKPRYLLTAVASIGFGAIVGGIYSYYRLLELRPIPNDSQKTLPGLIHELPDLEISRTIVSPTDRSGLEIILLQYPTCPFCCKVRAFLDYYGLSYSVIEVNPVLRQQLRWSQYKKVPIVLVRVDGGFQQLNDSSMIISALSSFLQEKHSSLTELVKYYPTIEFHDEEGYRKKEIMNRYFLMYQRAVPDINDDELKNERKWRKWADEDLVHTLSPNVYRTVDEAFQAFRWFSQVGEWDRIFSAWEVALIINVGAYAMWLIGKRLKQRHRLKDDIRQSLYDSCNAWLKELNKKGTPYHGGSSPNLADLAVYGVLCSIEGCDAFKDLLKNTKIRNWYYNMKKLCHEHYGSSYI